MKGKNLILSVGYANTISVPIPVGVTVAVEGMKVHVSGPSKQLVGSSPATCVESANLSRIKARASAMRARS